MSYKSSRRGSFPYESDSKNLFSLRELQNAIFSWRRSYSLQELQSDIIAGFTVFFLLIPQGISYAVLAGVSPVSSNVYDLCLHHIIFNPAGLWTILFNNSLVCIRNFRHVYADFHRSELPYIFAHSFYYAKIRLRRRFANVRLIEMFKCHVNYALLTKIASHREYIDVVSCMTIIAGISLILMGLTGCGILANFLSNTVLSGFTTGSAIFIGLSQLKYIFGYQHVPNVRK